MFPHRRRSPAFSLVELSIVLVILGLLTGGILAGQSLIRASEMRAVGVEYSKISTAYMSFRDKYFAIPGDMTNATSFWGISAGTGSDAACAASTSTTAATCNGNGDGMINTSTGSPEYWRQWQHMANAGLIEGSFNGQNTGGTYPATTEPLSKLSGGTWYGSWLGVFAGSVAYFAGDFGNHLEFSATASPFALLKPEEVWNFDTKWDDGNPRTGKIMGWKGTVANPCTTAFNTAVGADTAAAYNLSDSNKDCYIYFAKVI